MRIRVLICLLLASPISAAEPVAILLTDRASSPAAVVTVGHIATLTGPAEWKKVIAAMDLTDMPARENSVIVTRRQIEFRLKVAGLRDEDFRIVGADKITVVADRKPVPVEDVVIAAKAAIASRLPYPADQIVFDLVHPIALKMPEFGKAETVDIRAEPNSNTVAMGKHQVNVTISTRGEARLTLAVYLNARHINEPEPVQQERKVTGPMAPPLPRPGTHNATSSQTKPVATLPQPKAAPAAALAEEVLVKANQKVRICVSVGDIQVTALGESQQEGKLGQMIRVRNVDSNKVLTGRVSGRGTVEVE